MTAAAAASLLSQFAHSFVLVYIPDCDIAGHAHGWMSDAYLRAAATVDAAIGDLASFVADDLLLVTADHGGGGVYPHDHVDPHPHNERIPSILTGKSVQRRGLIRRGISLLDVPATVLWALGVPVPDTYEGRVVGEAFHSPLSVSDRSA